MRKIIMSLFIVLLMISSVFAEEISRKAVAELDNEETTIAYTDTKTATGSIIRVWADGTWEYRQVGLTDFFKTIFGGAGRQGPNTLPENDFFSRNGCDGRKYWSSYAGVCREEFNCDGVSCSTRILTQYTTQSACESANTVTCSGTTVPSTPTTPTTPTSASWSLSKCQDTWGEVNNDKGRCINGDYQRIDYSSSQDMCQFTKWSYDDSYCSGTPEPPTIPSTPGGDTPEANQYECLDADPLNICKTASYDGTANGKKLLSLGCPSSIPFCWGPPATQTVCSSLESFGYHGCQKFTGGLCTSDSLYSCPEGAVYRAYDSRDWPTYFCNVGQTRASFTDCEYGCSNGACKSGPGKVTVRNEDGSVNTISNPQSVYYGDKNVELDVSDPVKTGSCTWASRGAYINKILYFEDRGAIGLNAENPFNGIRDDTVTCRTKEGVSFFVWTKLIGTEKEEVVPTVTTNEPKCSDNQVWDPDITGCVVAGGPTEDTSGNVCCLLPKQNNEALAGFTYTLLKGVAAVSKILSPIYEAFGFEGTDLTEDEAYQEMEERNWPTINILNNIYTLKPDKCEGSEKKVELSPWCDGLTQENPSTFDAEKDIAIVATVKPPEEGDESAWSPTVSCIPKDRPFYTEGRIAYTTGVALSLLGGGKVGRVTQDDMARVDKILPGFSARYRVAPETACCGDLDEKYIDSRKETAISGAGLGVLWTDATHLSYDVYECRGTFSLTEWLDDAGIEGKYIVYGVAIVALLYILSMFGRRRY